MIRRSRFAFIQLGAFSNANRRIAEQMQRQFSDHDMDVVDLSMLLDRKDPLGVVACIREYGTDIMMGRRTLWSCVFRTPYAFRKARKLARAHLAGHGYRFTIQTQSIFDASVPGVPHFVYTDHTHLANLSYPDFPSEQLYSRSWIACEESTYHNAAMTLTMSTNIQRSVIEDYGCAPEKVKCVYCGANIEPDDAGDNDWKSRDGHEILFMGVDWQRKGGPTLVEAFRKVLRFVPDATLTIVGCSPKVEVANCEVIGRVPLADTRRYFERASVFCMPTTIEPVGFVFLEAMAFGLPIVATRVGAVPEIVEHGANGYLLQPNDPEALAHRLIELLMSRDRRRAFGTASHRRYFETYNWLRTGLRIRQCIESVIGGSPGRGAHP